MQGGNIRFSLKLLLANTLNMELLLLLIGTKKAQRHIETMCGLVSTLKQTNVYHKTKKRSFTENGHKIHPQFHAQYTVRYV